MIYMRGSNSVGKAPVKTATLTNQAVLWPVQTFGHPRNTFLDFAKKSLTISKILYHTLFSTHVLREKIATLQ